MTAPLVSIVIASYNYGRFLPEAIASALGQTWPSIEVIVVDDGSRDDSVAVARQHPVRLIAQDNRGVARARNRGASEARGELVVFLDADDVLEATFVERCSHALHRSGPEVAYAYAQMRKFGLEDALFPSRPFDGRALFEGNYIPVTTLLRRDVFLASGGFDPAWPAHEDHELWARLYALGHQGVYVPEPLLRYRFHGQSRNTLTQRQRDDLHVRLVLQYPRHGARWIARHPLQTASYLWRHRRPRRS